MILGHSMDDECLRHLRHGVGMLQVVSGLDQGEKKKGGQTQGFLTFLFFPLSSFFSYLLLRGGKDRERMKDKRGIYD